MIIKAVAISGALLLAFYFAWNRTHFAIGGQTESGQWVNLFDLALWPAPLLIALSMALFWEV